MYYVNVITKDIFQPGKFQIQCEVNDKRNLQNTGFLMS